jgi:flagellar basal body-associated protein FliL
MSKLAIVLPILLLASGGAYLARSGTPTEPSKAKVEAEVLVLGQTFFVDLDGDRAAMLRVSLLVEEFGPLPQEAQASAAVSRELKGASADKLLSSRGRHQLQERIRKRIKQETDMEIASVLFPDLTVH